MQINRPSARVPHAGTSPPRAPQQHSVSTSTLPTPLLRKHPKQRKQMTATVLIIVTLAILGGLLWQRLNDNIMANRYQAVFLSNGQVYFGKLHDYYGGRPYMTDVYYFQANSQTSSSSSAQQSGGNQLLVKLGQEIHAPENKLMLNKDSIMFVENLTDNGKVSEAINKDTQGTGTTTEASGGITR